MKPVEEIPQISEMTAVSLSLEQNLRNIELGPNGKEELEEYFIANPTHISANNAIFNGCYRTLGLIRFYTASEKEVKCYLLRAGLTVLDASGLVDVQIMR
jgi:ribosome-binding ATPase YchF (GTP1/OBG family)